MKYRQIKSALLITWTVLSGIILFALTAPFLLSADTLQAIVPTCEWKAKYNKECSFCGMTTGFGYITQGKFVQARKANRGSLYLYILFLLNEMAMVLALCQGTRKAKGSLACKQSVLS
jgi:hypothetical protein